MGDGEDHEFDRKLMQDWDVDDVQAWIDTLELGQDVRERLKAGARAVNADGTTIMEDLTVAAVQNEWQIPRMLATRFVRLQNAYAARRRGEQREPSAGPQPEFALNIVRGNQRRIRLRTLVRESTRISEVKQLLRDEEGLGEQYEIKLYTNRLLGDRETLGSLGITCEPNQLTVTFRVRGGPSWGPGRKISFVVHTTVGDELAFKLRFDPQARIRALVEQVTRSLRLISRLAAHGRVYLTEAPTEDEFTQPTLAPETVLEATRVWEEKVVHCYYDDPAHDPLAPFTSWTRDDVAEWLQCIPQESIAAELSALHAVDNWSAVWLVTADKSKLQQTIHHRANRSGRSGRRESTRLFDIFWGELKQLKKDPDYHRKRQAREQQENQMEEALERYSLGNVVLGLAAEGRRVHVRDLDRHRPRVVGLNNLGNTCFFNSALQPFLAAPEITPFFLRAHEMMEVGIEQDMEEAKESYVRSWTPSVVQGLWDHYMSPTPLKTRQTVVEEWVHMLHRVHGGDACSLSPHDLRDRLGRTSAIFRTRRQEDSFEALNELADRLQEDLLAIHCTRPTVLTPTRLELATEKDDAVQSEQRREQEQKAAPTILTSVLYGIEATSYQCYVCTYYCRDYGSFRFLPLPLTSHHGRATVLVLHPRKGEHVLHCDVLGYSPAETLRYEVLRFLMDDGVDVAPDDIFLGMLDGTRPLKNLQDVRVSDNRPVEGLCGVQSSGLVFGGVRTHEEATSKMLLISTSWNGGADPPPCRLVQWMACPFESGKRVRGRELINAVEDWQRHQEQLSVSTGRPLSSLTAYVVYGGQWIDPDDRRIEMDPNKVLYVCWSDRLFKDIPDSMRVSSRDKLQVWMEAALTELSKLPPAKRAKLQLLATDIGDADLPRVASSRSEASLARCKQLADHRDGQCKIMARVVHSSAARLMQARGFLRFAGTTDLSAVEECLEHLQKPEVLREDHFAFRCPECRTISRVVRRQRTLTIAPRILVLRLERFRNRQGVPYKTSTAVAFPGPGETLHVAGSAFQLFGVTSHFGSRLGGHYTAQVQELGGGPWYNVSDAARKQMSPSEVTAEGSTTAMLLFYAQRDDGHEEGTDRPPDQEFVLLVSDGAESLPLVSPVTSATTIREVQRMWREQNQYPHDVEIKLFFGRAVCDDDMRLGEMGITSSGNVLTATVSSQPGCCF